MTGPTWASTHAGAILLNAQIAFVWTAVNYAMPELLNLRRGSAQNGIPVNRAVWVRLIVSSAFAAGVSFWLARHNVAVAAIVLVGCMMLPLLRAKVSAGYAAEFEFVANAVFFAVIALAIRRNELSGHRLGDFPDHRSAAVFLIAAMILFSGRGGTYIVRGILDKVGTLPPLDGSTGRRDAEFQIDVKEYNRGRLIGNIERVLLVVMTAVHSYEALGFLIAAKGLIRSRELENRSWAEYFLVGTLASTLVALVVGLTMQLVLKCLW